MVRAVGASAATAAAERVATAETAAESAWAPCWVGRAAAKWVARLTSKPGKPIRAW